MAELLKSNKMFGGMMSRYRHQSACLGCPMTFSVFHPPPEAAKKSPPPVLYFLSGLTCTDLNFVEKAGAQRAAAAAGLALVAPDTSPRGLGVPGEADAWDFGVGAGFYLDATRPPWAAHWRMETYVMEELPAVLRTLTAPGGGGAPALDTSRAAVTGHSMGGHGALTLALRHPGRFASASALAPICNPSAAPWGRKAFAGYLGDDAAAWARHDACELVRRYAGPALDVLVDTGGADEFLERELRPAALEAAAAASPAVRLTSTVRPGYDHSYFFVASFIDDHVRHAARHLGLLPKE